MAGRWFVACGPDHGGRRQLEAQLRNCGLVKRFECRSYTLLADSGVEMLVRPGASVAVIGRLLDRDSFGRIARLGEKRACAIAENAGGELGGRCWGSYVALVGDPASGVTRLLRDPSGGMPAYWMRWPSLWVASGDAQLLARLSIARPRIDFAGVAARLVWPGRHFARTALTDLEELLPGHALTTGPKSSCSAFWRPWDFGRTVEPSADMLANVVDRTIDALASCHRRILVTVSGGLDSSIIASSLGRQEHSIGLFNAATSDPRGDERPYAGLLAEALGVELAVERYRHADIDLAKPSAGHLPWPSARTFAQGYDRRRQAYALAIGADAIFGGDGGDNIFNLTMSAGPVIDRLRAEGVRAANLTATDIARLTSTSIPAVWRKAIALRLRRGGATGERRLLSGQAVALADGPEPHPWLAASDQVPPGKRAHIAALVRGQRYHDGHGRGAAESVLPLLAQPIVETCLAIPSWRWCEGGENRAVARRAFAAHLPDAITRRRVKGGPDSFCVEIVERHCNTIRELLLGGALADRGLLDTAGIDRSLRSGDALRGDVHRILALVDTEAWVRAWNGGGNGYLPSDS